MNLYRLMYKIDNWTIQPVKVWAKDEQEAIKQGQQELILAGHKQYDFKTLVKLGGK